MSPLLLSLLPMAVPAAVIDRIKQRRVHARTIAGGVRLSAVSGKHYDFGLATDAAPLPLDTSVYMWWGADGLVCAPVSQVDAAEARSSGVAKQVLKARAALARARRKRATLSTVDIAL